MRTLTRLSSVAVLFFALCAFAPEARADGVMVITGGSGTSGNFNGGGFTLIGQNFTFNGGFNYGPNNLPAAAGGFLSIGSFNLGLDVRSGPGTLNGVSYNQLFYDGFVSFSGVVAIPPDDLQVLFVSVPFTFNAQLGVCTHSTFSGPCTPGYLVQATFVGSGTALVELSSFLHTDGTRRYGLRSVTYNFEGPAAATPEPATIALLGTALAALGAGARRRRARREREEA